MNLRQLTKDYQTVLVLSAGLIALGWYFMLPMLSITGLIFMILSGSSSRFTILLAKVWMGLGHALGAIQSRILLSVIYLFILTPIAWLRKAITSPLKKPTWVDVRHKAVNFEQPW